jgi:hypothetical protein
VYQHGKLPPSTVLVNWQSKTFQIRHRNVLVDDDLLEEALHEARTYTETDFNRIIEIADRERYRVTVFMESIDQTQKTLSRAACFLVIGT